MKKLLVWICVMAMLSVTFAGCENRPTTDDGNHPLSDVAYSLGDYQISSYFLSVVYNGEYYFMCDKICDRNELDYFLVGSDAVGEAKMIDGEIVGIPDVASGKETNYLESGTKLYIKDDCIIGVYSQAQTSGTKSVYGVLFKTTDPAQLPFDLSKYEKGIFTVNVLMYDDILYGWCAPLTDPTELMAYMLNGEYVGDIQKIVSEFVSNGETPDDGDITDGEYISMPKNDFESTVLDASTKLYLIGDNIAAKLPEPIKINGKVIYGCIYSKNGNHAESHDEICTCKYYTVEHGDSSEQTEIHDSTDGRECVVTYTAYEHLMFCTECGKYLGSYYKECSEIHSACSKMTINCSNTSDFEVADH